jgi:hypothetical protein
MLDARESKPIPLPLLQKPIRGLCTTGCERHSLRLYIKDAGHGFTGGLDDSPGHPAFRVNGRRVSNAFDRSQHGLARFRPKRRRRVVIEVAADTHDPTFAAAAISLNEKLTAGSE